VDRGRNTVLVSKKVVRDLKRRDERAFNEVYASYRKLLFFIIVSITKNETSAEDILQDTFVKVYEAVENLEDDANFHSYICTTAKNLALNEIKRSRKVEELDPLLDVYGHEDEQFGLLKEIGDYLSDLENTIVIYKIVHGFGFKEISDFTGIPLSTVYQIYRRALVKIKEHYGGKRT